MMLPVKRAAAREASSKPAASARLRHRAAGAWETLPPLPRPDLVQNERGITPNVRPSAGAVRHARIFKAPPGLGQRQPALGTGPTLPARAVQEASTSTAAPASSPPSLAPKRVAIFVEPSPFTYVCGYKNRYCNAIKYLVEAGCEVLVVTTGQQTCCAEIDARR